MHNWMGVPSRIRLLLGFHLILGIIPAATYVLPLSTWLLPVMWVIAAFSVAQLMLLSFWVGMASNSVAVRLIGGLCGTAYVTIWPIVAQLLSPHHVATGRSLMTEYFISFCSYSSLVVLIAGSFMLIRRRGTMLYRPSRSESEVAPTRVQYSIYNLLVITSICAIVLGLGRNARPDSSSPTVFSEWQWVAGMGLMLTVFLLNSVCAAWATLSLGKIGLRITLVFVVAILLGVALSISMGHHEFGWELRVGGSLMMVFFTAVVIGSLLIVRTCGYRLVPKGRLLLEE